MREIMTLPHHNRNVGKLIDRCLQRPANEAAWQEFVRRFHPTIHASVMKSIGLIDRSGNISDDVIEELIQAVYSRLIEDESRALKEAGCARTQSLRNYLVLIAARTVRERFGPADRPN